jgi:aldehyde dehydrogenase (NAD+)
LPAPGRGEILRRAAEILEGRAKTISYELASEEGKTVSEALAEIHRAVAVLRYYAAQTTEPDGETYPSHASGTLLYSRREAVGTVLAITPWNFPIAIPAWKIAPALAYGNTVVWKPAGPVPLTSLRFLESLIDAGIPQGVVNLVVGSSSVVGDSLVVEGVDAITFTGSNSVGRAIQRRAVDLGIKVQLEMGGKNPAIVMASADMQLAVDRVARGAFLSAGQKCTATSRVIIVDEVFDHFAAQLADVAERWKVGDALAPDTVVGPVVSQEQFASVLEYLRVGTAEDANYIAGGSQADGPGGGYYIKPTVVTGLRSDSRLAKEEIFGPVATLLRARDYDDAIRLANDTQYGLSASLFTSDLAEAMRFAMDIQAGIVKINEESAGVEFHVPFGGVKDSSTGSREQGKAAREFFTAWKSVYIALPRPERAGNDGGS